MLFKGLIITLLSTAALANEFYANVEHEFGVMLARGEAIAKRQGYYPTTRPCGSGKTCAEACGAGSEQCPSRSGLYCHEPARSKCCPDQSGKACQNGYFCTTDGKTSPTTYCCPDGMDLGACAKAYSLTVSLIRQSSTLAASSASSLASPVVASSQGAGSSAPVTTTPLVHVSYPTATATVKPSSNATVTTSPPTQFSGAAAKVGSKGMAVLAGVAGFARLL